MTNDNELKAAAATLGRKGGKSTSAAKVAAVKENGKKGGRPKFLGKWPEGNVSIGDILSTTKSGYIINYEIVRISIDGSVYGIKVI